MADAPPISLMGIQQDSNPSFESLEDKYICLVCRNPLRSPVQTECGHRMCRPCAEDLFASTEGNHVPCPADNGDCETLSMSKIYPDYCALKEMEKLNVRCKNSKLGCQEVYSLKELKNHMQACAFSEISCPHQQFGCTAKLTRKDFDKHIYQACEYLPTPCNFCNTEFPKNKLEEHIDNACLQNIKQCRHVGCNFKGGKTELSRHEQGCELRPSDCHFKFHGCEFTGLKMDILNHEKNDSCQHLQLLSSSTININSQVGGLLEEFEKLKTLVGRFQIQSFGNKEVAKMKDAIELQEKKIRDLQKTVAAQLEKMNELDKKTQQTFVGQGDFKCFEREIIAAKDSQSNMQRQLRALENKLKHGVSDDQRQRALTLERQIGIHDVRLAEMDLRFQCLESCGYSGVLIWKIENYTRRKQEAVAGRTLSLYSQPFYTSRYGYKMCCRAYLNGDGLGKSNYLSLFFVVMRGEYDNIQPWPFKQKVTMSMLDQENGKRHISDMFKPDVSSSSFKKPISEMNVAAGCPKFSRHSVLERSPYLIDDCLFLKIVVDVNDLNLP